MLTHVLLACGFLAWMGLFPGFARADNVLEYENRMISIQAGQLDDKIQEARKNMCIAIATKNVPAFQAWTRELDAMVDKYRHDIKAEPRVKNCDELLIGGTQG